jgi:hypothetical protein
MHDHHIGVQIGLCFFFIIFNFFILFYFILFCLILGSVGAQLFGMTTMVEIKVMSSIHIFMHLLYTIFLILVDANLKASISSLY